ncbi:MAG: TetR/AcrR family transcriptional regulator [Nitrospirae bacterium]|nr:TetR/AcrR family transcriptional regulator [Nitrospirota bacterium]
MKNIAKEASMGTSILEREHVRDEQETRKKIIATAFEEIYLNGYHGASLNRIIEKSGFTKGALYHYFPSKKELALAAIEETITLFLKTFWEQPLLNAENPLAALLNHIKNLPVIVFANCRVFDIKHGCPLNNLIQEMSPIDEEFARTLEALYNSWQNLITRVVERAREKGQLRANIAPGNVAMFILSALEGCITAAKKSNSVETFTTCMRELEVYVLSLAA